MRALSGAKMSRGKGYHGYESPGYGSRGANSYGYGNSGGYGNQGGYGKDDYDDYDKDYGEVDEYGGERGYGRPQQVSQAHTLTPHFSRLVTLSDV